MEEKQKWIMLTYKPPKAKTSAAKVALWRKLKKLGVYQVQDSVCVLPFSEKNMEDFQWVSAEVIETGGDASVWSITSLSPEKERELRDFFIGQTNIQYQKLMSDCAETTDENELRKLWTLFHRVKAQDHLKSPLSVEVKAVFENRMEELANMEIKK